MRPAHVPHLNETRRRLSNLVRLGTVLEVDHERARCRVQSDGNHTGWLPWLAPRTGPVMAWSAPGVGEQVIVLSPEGDLTGGVVLRGLYCDAFPPPSTAETIHITVYPDGAALEYDHAAHTLTAILPEGGTATVTAPGGITLNGPLTVNGQTTLNGDTGINGEATVSQSLTAQTDVIGGGVSLTGHVHGGIKAGPDSSGPPQ